jgi:hypothetical protein
MLSDGRAAFELSALTILPFCVAVFVSLHQFVEHLIVKFLCCIEYHIRSGINGLSFIVVM